MTGIITVCSIVFIACIIGAIFSDKTSFSQTCVTKNNKVWINGKKINLKKYGITKVNNVMQVNNQVWINGIKIDD